MKKQLLLLVMLLLPMMARAYTFSAKNDDGVMIYYDYTSQGIELVVTCGDNDYRGSVIIPETVTYLSQTLKVTGIGEKAFAYCTRLTSVTIPNSVKSIGDYAFYSCDGLTSITIPNSVKSIGSCAFSGCKSLASITLGSSVTSIEEDTFRDCSSLTFITIPNSVTSIGKFAFSDCSGLTSVTIGNSVTSIGNFAFSGCSGLTSITIPNCVTSISNYAFNLCSSITSITIGNSVTSIGQGAFRYCSSLPSITIPNSVTTIGQDSFSECSSLISVSIPNSVTNIGFNAFANCNNLSTVVSKIENPFAISTLTFSDYTFNNATLYVPKGTGYKYKNTKGWEKFVSIDDNGGENNEHKLIYYPMSIEGIDLLASDYGQVGFSTIFINNNSTEVNCIKFGKSYKCTSNEYYYATLRVTGGFKAGDVIEIAGAYNNQDTKNSAISFRIDPTSSNPIWTTDNFINGRYSSEEPQIQTYTLTTDADVLYFGRSGNTGTGVTRLRVIRYQEVLPTGIEINETNFPDANFRSYLLSQSYGADGKITESEIKNIVKINVNKKGIISLKGIEFFTALSNLICGINQLTALDVSKNTALTRLDCCRNQLTALDVSKNTALTTFYCSSNQFTALDVSKNTALTSLSCSSNQLTALDVSKNTALTELGCDNNQLTSLDVSKNTALTYLYCYSNQLTALDVSKNTALTRLDCCRNQLTALDVSKNTALTTFYCSSNQFTALDVSKNTALTSLSCSSNQLTALDVSKNAALTWLECYLNQIKGTDMDNLINSLPNNTSAQTYTFRVYYPTDKEGNVCTTNQAAAAKAKGWTPLYYDGTEWKEYAGSEPERLSYTLTYVVDGETYKTYSIKEGEAITPEPAPTKEGYTFSGWSEIPSTMPANDVTVTGSFTINKYKLIYKVDGEVYKEFDVEYGATITPETAPTKEGYTFSGWSDIPETMPAHDVTITGSFTQIKKADPDLAINSNEHWVNPFGFYVTIGQTYNSPKLINPHGLSPITWTSSHPEVATVGDNGVLTLQSAGSTQIKATFAGNNEYNAGYAEYSLIVLDGYKVTSEGTVTLTGGNQTGEVTIETTVNINGQTYKVTAIGENAFNGNTQITTVTIPDGISVIGANAFSGCINLLVINIGKSVTSIGNKAFANVGTSPSARTRGEGAFIVNCYAESVPQTATDAFENSPIATGTLLVNDNIVDAYKTTSPWSQFGKIQGFQEAAGIDAISIDNPNAYIYDMQGNRIDNLQKGVNIIRLEDGKTKKVIVK